MDKYAVYLVSYLTETLVLFEAFVLRLYPSSAYRKPRSALRYRTNEGHTLSSAASGAESASGGGDEVVLVPPCGGLEGGPCVSPILRNSE
jgi:hypothetical protein